MGGRPSVHGMIHDFKNFRRVETCVDTRPFVSEIRTNKHLWLLNTRRQDRIFVQRETNTIVLRGADMRGHIGVDVREIQLCIMTSKAVKFPRLMQFLAKFARDQDKKLQRIMIVRLKPNGQVYPHIDAGSYYAARDRFHLVLISPCGSCFKSGPESVIFQEGDLWWFNNKVIHSSRNDSDVWRVHVIFDLLPRSRRREHPDDNSPMNTAAWSTSQQVILGTKLR
jgi:hypothetical protein